MKKRKSYSIDYSVVDKILKTNPGISYKDFIDECPFFISNYSYYARKAFLRGEPFDRHRSRKKGVSLVLRKQNLPTTNSDISPNIDVDLDVLSETDLKDYLDSMKKAIFYTLSCRAIVEACKTVRQLKNKYQNNIIKNLQKEDI